VIEYAIQTGQVRTK